MGIIELMYEIEIQKNYYFMRNAKDAEIVVISELGYKLIEEWCKNLYGTKEGTKYTHFSGLKIIVTKEIEYNKVYVA